MDDAELDARLRELSDALCTETPASDFVPAKRRRIPRIGRGQDGVVRLRGRIWRLQFRSPPDADGKRRQRSVRVGTIDEMTEEQARTAARLMLERLAPRRIEPGSTCTWESWCERYLSVYVAMLRRTSQESVSSAIRVHLVPAFADLYLHEIRVARVQSWIARQRTFGAAPSTIAWRYALLRRMLRRARREGLAVEVPTADDVDLPRSDAVSGRRHVRGFTTDELRQILAVTEEPWKTLFMLCAFCGLRISEALGLRWSDVSLDTGRLSIVRQATYGKESRPKTEASIAERRIPPMMLEHLRAFAAGRIAEDGLLFPSPRGGPYHASGVRKHHLTPILRRLGITGRSFHGFRHWLGTTAARHGIPLPAVQRVMRHRDPRSTQVYIEVAGAEVDAAIVGVESRYLESARNVLSGAPKPEESEMDVSR
jgi:integrase